MKVMSLLSKIKTGQVKETVNTSYRLMKLIWQTEPGLLTVSIIAVLIPAVIPFVNIYIYKLVIDLVVGVVSGSPFDPAQFYPLIGFRILTFFIQGVAFRTQDYIARILWTKVPIEMDNIILTKVASLDLHYFEDDKFRDLLERAREAYKVRPHQLVDTILFLFQSILQFLIAFVTLVQLNWFFIILITVVAIPEFITQTYQSKLAWGIWGDRSPYRKRFNHLSHVLFHHREVKEIKIFNLAQNFIGEIKKLQTKFFEDNKNLAQKSYSSGVIFNLLSSGVFIGIEIYVIFEALAKRVTVGDISFYTGVVNNFQNGLGGLLRNMNGIFEHSLYVKSVFELLDIEPILPVSKNPVSIDTRKAPTIEFRDVSFAYPKSENKILNNFSITINPGEKVAFVGENGAGKTTLVKLLARFYDVDSGEILINGIDIKELDRSQWHKVIGVLFQDFNRYEDPAKENISYGNIESIMDQERVMKAASSAGAHQMIQKLERGYEQMLGRMFEGGIELSVGQWQKIALARAFFRNAPVLILDEPTASIDAKAESEIFNRVEKLSKDKTVIIISHRFSTVRNADKIYVIENGRIVESGSHKQLMEQNGQYSALFKLQAKGYQ